MVRIMKNDHEAKSLTMIERQDARLLVKYTISVPVAYWLGQKSTITFLELKLFVLYNGNRSFNCSKSFPQYSFLIPPPLPSPLTQPSKPWPLYLAISPPFLPPPPRAPS